MLSERQIWSVRVAVKLSFLIKYGPRPATATEAKSIPKTHWTEATCEVWVRHTAQGYEVLSSLGHMMGGADKQIIVDSSLLPTWTSKPTNTEAISHSDNKRTLFSFSSLQLFGGLER